jgi:indolepyruvate ferredoxin oxidoreductase beta subunit
MGDTFNIIACGVGGQGVVLMSNVVGQACALSGQKAISGEMHGLSQRSGSVFIHQRIGDRALSPLIPYGEADVILALEPMEALRYLFYLKPGGAVITNTEMVHPPNETEEKARGERKKYIRYETVIETIKGTGAKVVEVDALELAYEAGSPLTVNVVMVGALSGLPGFPVGKEAMMEAVKGTVPPKAIETNAKAFENGFSICRDAECWE